MKKKIPGILFGLLFLIGFGLLVYPTVADQWNTYRQSRLISSYERTVEEMEPEDFSAEWEKARAFNDTLTQNSIYGDVFGEEDQELKLKVRDTVLSKTSALLKNCESKESAISILSKNFLQVFII